MNKTSAVRFSGRRKHTISLEETRTYLANAGVSLASGAALETSSAGGLTKRLWATCGPPMKFYLQAGDDLLEFSSFEAAVETYNAK